MPRKTSSTFSTPEMPSMSTETKILTVLPSYARTRVPGSRSLPGARKLLYAVGHEIPLFGVRVVARQFDCRLDVRRVPECADPVVCSGPPSLLHLVCLEHAGRGLH